MICACCGGDAGHYAQWHNQDKGHGICRTCVERVKAHRPFGHDPITPEQFQRTYGIEGVNYASANGKYAVKH